MPVVDAHAHFLPPELIARIRAGAGPPGVRLEEPDVGPPSVVHDGGTRYLLAETFWSPEAKLAEMDRLGIDRTIVSIAPPFLMYSLDAGALSAHCRQVNDEGATFVARGGGRLAALATLPLTDPAAAARELCRAVGELGHVGAEIGTGAPGLELDSGSLAPLYSTAEELDVPLLLHPHVVLADRPPAAMRGYHLPNLIDNPTQTSVAAARMILGGVFDRHPGLRVLLVHGGGFLPYQLGRIEHAYRQRPDASVGARRPPSAYLQHLLFDTVIFDRRALGFLVERVGAERVVLGTDLPFDMADRTALELGADGGEAARLILGANAERAFALD